MKLCFKRNKCWSLSSDLLFSPGMFDPHQSDGIRATLSCSLFVFLFLPSDLTHFIQDNDEPLLELLQDVKITFRCRV